MRNLVLLAYCVIQLSTISQAQNIGNIAPSGFDQQQQAIAHGQIDTLEYTSSTVGTTRKVLVYTPPGYNKNNKYPVLYLLHGIGGDEYEWLKNGQPQVILDNLYAQGKVTPMVVVLPNGRAMKDDRAVGDIFEPAKVQAFAAFENDLLTDLIPFIEKKYSVLSDSKKRAIAGLSMGGGQSLNIGLQNLQMFSWIGAFSAAPNTKVPEDLLPNPEEAKKKLQLLWLSCGKDDNLMRISTRTHDYLQKNNVPHIFYVELGGHDFKVWKNDLYMFSQLLFKPVDVKSFPKFTVLERPNSSKD